MKHKSLLVYVPCLEGGYEDAGRVDLAGYTLISDERLYNLEAAEKERDALRTKIERMEQQKPVGEIQRANSTGNYINSVVWVPMAIGTKLYALPGAQPAPSVPDALLVAVADLVAQMEIVARVGFVDAPDDKDSCAAFCVAEGTWLELMSAIESLASALAAAPEAKP